MCLDNQILEQLIKLMTQYHHFKYTVSTHQEHQIILVLSRLLCSTPEHQNLVMNNEQLLKLIVNCLYSFERETNAISAAFFAINNILDLKKDDFSLKLIKCDQGQLIKSIFWLMEIITFYPKMHGFGMNPQGDEYVNDGLLKCLGNIVNLMKSNDNIYSYVTSIMVNENFVKILKKWNDILKEKCESMTLTKVVKYFINILTTD